MKGKAKNIVRVLLLLLFLGYYGGITLFPHTHMVDGVPVVHSHPCLPGHAQHEHTADSYVIINLLIHFVLVIVALLDFTRVIRLAKPCDFHCSATRLFVVCVCSFNALRGPPVRLY